MQILIVNIHVKPENARHSRQEPGIARFDFLQQADDPTRFVLYEVYRDADAPARHRETPHYKAWVEKVPDMLAEPRTRVFYSNVSPADAEW